MSRAIDYYFTLVSPWAYLGHDAFLDLARRHDLAVAFKPVLLNKVFPESGGLPLPQRHPLRQRYRLMELQRWRDARRLPLNIRPKYWPFDVTAADRLVVAAQMAGADAGKLARLLFRAVFVEERDLGQRQTLASILAEGGFDASLLTLSENDATTGVYDATPAEALAAGVFGSPSWVLDGEVFWGQDRIELLDAALTSGRKPFSADI